MLAEPSGGKSLVSQLQVNVTFVFLSLTCSVKVTFIHLASTVAGFILLAHQTRILPRLTLAY